MYKLINKKIDRQKNVLWKQPVNRIKMIFTNMITLSGTHCIYLLRAYYFKLKLFR
jgi:hypothetical protein